MANIILNKTNFFNNLQIILDKTKSKNKIALVLKDNAYGHGILEIAGMAQEFGLSRAVVQSYDEALKIEKFFEYVLVLADFPVVQNNKIRYTINSLESIKKFPKDTKVELKVDTGMHRNGIAMGELKEALKQIEEAKLVLEAVFTHHRSADELSSEWFWQNENFKKVKDEVLALGYKNLRFHSSNSASLFRFNEFSEDMARVGICAYGCMEMAKPLGVDGFKPVLSLYADKISSRELKKGDAIGYGASFYLKEDSVISNYDFGYGDGFLRVLSNNYKTPKSKKLVGRISMDNSSFICSDDKILIFDDARVIASFAKTISYEVLTSLKATLKREIVCYR